MTNKEILEKAIRKAIKGGWVDGDVALMELKHKPDFAIPNIYAPMVIYNHNFAKALWSGKSKIVSFSASNESDFRHVPLWEYHLQNMVIADDPIAYLGGNI